MMDTDTTDLRQIMFVPLQIAKKPICINIMVYAPLRITGLLCEIATKFVKKAFDNYCNCMYIV
jgi:hypothetical protein